MMWRKPNGLNALGVHSGCTAHVQALLYRKATSTIILLVHLQFILSVNEYDIIFSKKPISHSVAIFF